MRAQMFWDIIANTVENVIIYQRKECHMHAPVKKGWEKKEEKEQNNWNTENKRKQAMTD